MSQKNVAADKVRPILKALEQSIEAARSTRLQPAKPAVISARSEPIPAAIGSSPGVARLKARPKRAWI